MENKFELLNNGMGENLSILSPDEMDDIIGGDFSMQEKLHMD